MASGRKNFEMMMYYRDCIVVKKGNPKGSAYFSVEYKGEQIRFCISNHHSPHRKNLLTIISGNRTIKNAKRIAWDIKFSNMV